MTVTEKTPQVFLPVHPKCKSEILSVRYNLRELWLGNNTTSALTPGDARELGEAAGLTQIAGEVKEQTPGGHQGRFFSRIILHFEAASY